MSHTMSRASSRSSRHMKLVVTAMLSLTYSPTGSASSMCFLYVSISGAIFSGVRR